MVQYQKFLFDNFVIQDKEEVQPLIEIPETDTALSVPEEADNVPVSEEEEPAEEKESREEAHEKEESYASSAAVELPPVIQGYTEEEVAEKIKAAEAAAFQKGLDEAAASAAESDKKMLERLSESMEKALSDYKSLRDSLNLQFKDMAKALVSKLVPSLLEKDAENLIAEFLEENFKNFAAEPKLAFYFNPAVIGKAQEVIARLARTADFEGKIALHKDAKLPPQDCRVEWENGGAERNSTDMLDKTIKILDTE